MTLDPSIALSTCETALRQLMAYRYAANYGPEWLQRVATPRQLEAWEGLAAVERSTRQRRGAAEVPGPGLAYAHFYDLVTIAKKHWEPLAPALGKRATIIPLLERFESLRNPVGHSRALLKFEQELLSGIAGQIRNQVTIYMSSQDPVGDIYPRIESITDSFGRRVESSEATGEVAGSATAVPYLIVQPGDTVSFTCVGLDPQDRDLHWELRTSHSPRGSLSGASGVPAELVWEVDESDVNETQSVQIFMSTATARYHRYGSFDHRAYFMFRVRPPA